MTDERMCDYIVVLECPSEVPNGNGNGESCRFDQVADALHYSTTASDKVGGAQLSTNQRSRKQKLFVKNDDSSSDQNSEPVPTKKIKKNETLPLYKLDANTVDDPSLARRIRKAKNCKKHHEKTHEKVVLWEDLMLEVKDLREQNERTKIEKQFIIERFEQELHSRDILIKEQADEILNLELQMQAMQYDL